MRKQPKPSGGTNWRKVGMFVLVFCIALMFLWNVMLYNDRLCEQKNADVEKDLREQAAKLLKELQLGNKREAHLVDNLSKKSIRIQQLQKKIKELSGQKKQTTTSPSTTTTSTSNINDPNQGQQHSQSIVTPKPQHSSQSSLGKIGLVIIAHRRTEYLKRCLESVQKVKPDTIDVFVSQDGTTQNWARDLEQLVLNTPWVGHIKHLNDEPIRPAPGESAGYYAIARHYGFALSTMFSKGYDYVIILEEDLEVSPDFFDYFVSTIPILRDDPKIWCVSAWNDNGMNTHVKDPEAVYRADFFPGLGWMMDKTLWAELGPKWAKGYWDDWMREPPQRRGRQCIRPEISRTYTFGAQGVSQGEFFASHLSKIKLNDRAVNFAAKDMSYLMEEHYERYLNGLLDKATQINGKNDIQSNGNAEFVIKYRNKMELSSHLNQFQLMDDAKAGVPRTAYRGIVTFRWMGNRIHLVPDPKNFLY